MSSAFIFTSIAPQDSTDATIPAYHMSNAKHPLHDPLHAHLLTVSHDVPVSRKRPALRLANLFARPSTHASPDASTPSASRSISRSPSPTSSFLIDEDPFARIDSPVFAPLDFVGLDSLPTSPAAEFMDTSARPPLAPRQPVMQRHSHDHRPPVSFRARPHKLVRNTPSLPSLTDLARATGSSYASAIARTSASKRFPLEPWDLPDIPQVSSAEPDENYISHPPSKFANVKGTILHRNSVASAFTNKSPAPELRKRQSNPVLRRSTLSPDTHVESFRWTHPGENCGSYRHPDSPHTVGLHCEVQDGFSWWDVVYDSKDASGSEEDEDESDTLRPPIHEATPHHEQGYRADMQHAGEQRGEDDTSSDCASDGYGSDGAGSGGYGGGTGNGGGRGNDEDGDDTQGRPVVSDDQDTDEDESSSSSSSSEDSEDNVPLAQRIPGALLAQRSIRIKAKAERERRRQERHPQKHPSVKDSALPKPQPRVAPLADDLTKRLLQVQASDSASTPSASQRQVLSSMPAVRGRAAPSVAQPQQSTGRAARSPHRSAGVPAQTSQPRHVSLEESRMRYNQQEGSSMQYIQDTSSAPLSRHPTNATARSRKASLSQPATQFAPSTQAHSASQSHSRDGISRHSSNAQSQVSTQPRFPPPHGAGQHQAQDLQHHSDAGHRKSHDATEEREGAVVRTRALSSAPAPTHRVLQRARTVGGASSAPPPMPPFQFEMKRQGRDVTVTQHRVFVGDMQRFNTVEITAQTRAKDVLDLIEARGELHGEAAAQPGGWMVWELAQDFGMERPLREYELPAEVYASWNSDTRMNAFLIKKTPLAAVLARNAMPSSSPRCSGYVQWESKRGKWNKRWMELREHSIWLSKRYNGRDETFLCSLSNFDCYYVSRLHKAPKSFVFAIKSTDNLTLFENPADYLHIFSCDPKDGEQWMACILLARSYVLHKERTVLFSTPSSASSSTIPPPSNSGPFKSPSLSRPAAPLVQTSTNQSTAAKGLFQSGSLLAKTST